ncbi:MAG: hypothetical protein ABSE91_00570 [Patescibacteria group bacterium]|jgi:hypothetical protein
MDDKRFDPAEIIKQPPLNKIENDHELDDRVGELTDDEWDQVTKLQGQNRSDGTVISREEAVQQVLAARKK